MEFPSATLEFVHQLCHQFCEQVGKAMKFSLTVESSGLALVDHYLSLARTETRVAVLQLLAAGAGAYFGELVRQEIGGFWIGDGKDPRRLRFLLDVQPIFFAPFDIAYESILFEPLAQDDPRHPEGPTLDTEIHVGSIRTNDKGPSTSTNEFARPRLGESNPDRELISEQEWVRQRLDEIAPVNDEEFYSLTGRYETLTLIISLLTNKHVSEGRQPHKYVLEDYLSLLTMKNPS